MVSGLMNPSTVDKKSIEGITRYEFKETMYSESTQTVVLQIS